MIRPLPSLQQTAQATASATRLTGNRADTPFADVLSTQLTRQGEVQFSNHAQSRIASRNIAITPSEQAEIRNAVDQAASKGAREALLLLDQAALVVSVPNRTVITALGRNELASHVFTNIDSAVIVPSESTGVTTN